VNTTESRAAAGPLNRLVGRPLKCTCRTTKACQDFLDGLVDKVFLSRAIEHHVNHACPDFSTVCGVLWSLRQPNAKISGTMAGLRGSGEDRGGQSEQDRAERKELSGEEKP